MSDIKNKKKQEKARKNKQLWERLLLQERGSQAERIMIHRAVVQQCCVLYCTVYCIYCKVVEGSVQSKQKRYKNVLAILLPFMHGTVPLTVLYLSLQYTQHIVLYVEALPLKVSLFVFLILVI